MRVVIASDKFKGSLSAPEAAAAMAAGVRDVLPEAEVVVCPMADGGEGTVEAVAAATGAEVRVQEVSGPLPGQLVSARWDYLLGGRLPRMDTGSRVASSLDPEATTAVLEMAQASGFSLVPAARRDPYVTTTLGTGQLVRAALDAGCSQIVVGVGGSATVDGGTGMARALGYRFLDGDGSEVPPGGGSLEMIRSIDTAQRDERLDGATVLVASDVDNTLIGPQGAARIYGPQKGANPDQVEGLDRGLANLGSLIKSELGVNVVEMRGAGAAGGLGAGLVAFCGARIVSGVALVAEIVGLGEKLRGADLALTGEGSFDSQTAHGKTPAGVASMASETGVPTVILAGRVATGAIEDLGEDVAVFSVCPGPMDEAEAMARAAETVRSGTARLMILLKLGARLDE
jgi:glycerate kinase